VSEKLVAAWRARAAKEYPSDLRAAAPPVRYTLLATLCHVRETEIADSLLQDILSEEKRQTRLTDADRQALSPLFWTQVNPYGRFELDMASHLDITLPAVPCRARAPCRMPTPVTGSWHRTVRRYESPGQAQVPARPRER
jgi:hypothetical protein